MIGPDYAPHKNLEGEVKEFLESCDFLIYEATYHSVASDEIARILRNRFTPTALYLRGRADRIAIHKTRKCEFEFECKTHLNDKHYDWTLELLPFLHHLSKSRFGVNCLYVYRGNVINDNQKEVIECGFLVDEFPKIREVWIPPRAVNDIPYYKDLVNKWLPDVPIIERTVGGSGDPFLIIDQSTVKQLPDWKDLFLRIY